MYTIVLVIAIQGVSYFIVLLVNIVMYLFVTE